jgi:GntR family transcriptional regulator, transcriptional repressor for pyruvate dehydrogenase complex
MAAPVPTTAFSRRGHGAGVVQAILNLIQEQDLKPGDRLPAIRELAASLEVPPTLVRDGLLRAQTMGLVRIVPRGGAFVQSLNYAPLVDALVQTLQPALMQEDHNLLHLIEARNLIEVELVGKAAERRRLEDLLPVRNALEAMVRTDHLVDYVAHDVRFHYEIGRLAGNTVLSTFHQALLGLLRTFLTQQIWNTERQDLTTRAHTAVYEALVAGDADRARTAMLTHLSASTVVLEVLAPPTIPLPRG